MQPLIALANPSRVGEIFVRREAALENDTMYHSFAFEYGRDEDAIADKKFLGGPKSASSEFNIVHPDLIPSSKRHHEFSPESMDSASTDHCLRLMSPIGTSPYPNPTLKKSSMNSFDYNPTKSIRVNQSQGSQWSPEQVEPFLPFADTFKSSLQPPPLSPQQQLQPHHKGIPPEFNLDQGPQRSPFPHPRRNSHGSERTVPQSYTDQESATKALSTVSRHSSYDSFTPNWLLQEQSPAYQQKPGGPENVYAETSEFEQIRRASLHSKASLHFNKHDSYQFPPFEEHQASLYEQRLQLQGDTLNRQPQHQHPYHNQHQWQQQRDIAKNRSCVSDPGRASSSFPAFIGKTNIFIYTWIYIHRYIPINTCI
jgi:hypothetical protein